MIATEPMPLVSAFTVDTFSIVIVMNQHDGLWEGEGYGQKVR